MKKILIISLIFIGLGVLALGIVKYYRFKKDLAVFSDRVEKVGAALSVVGCGELTGEEELECVLEANNMADKILPDDLKALESDILGLGGENLGAGSAYTLFDNLEGRLTKLWLLRLEQCEAVNETPCAVARIRPDANLTSTNRDVADLATSLQDIKDKIDTALGN